MKAVKEKAADAGASAIASMDKAKAIVEEKVEKMATSDPLYKEKAAEKKAVRVNEAELNKQEAFEQNAAARMGTAHGGFTVTGTGAYTAGTRR